MTRCFTAKPTCGVRTRPRSSCCRRRARGRGRGERRASELLHGVLPFGYGVGRSLDYAATGGGLLHGLELDRDLDLLADEHAAGLERGVPDEPEVAAVERGLGGEAGALVAPRVLAGAGELGVEDHLALHAVQLEVARHAVARAGLLDPLRAEGELGVLRDVEEVRGAQVRVAVRHLRVDGGGVDAHVDRGAGEVLRVELDAPAHLAKRPCTLEMTMWRTWKWTAEWLTSMSQWFVMFGFPS